MNQETTPICEMCKCEERKFIHVFYNGVTTCRLCTSCVLLTYVDSFCPTCFEVHDNSSGGLLIRCDACCSKSHPICIASNCSSSPLCSACRDSDRLIFSLKEVKAKGGNVLCNLVYPNSTVLLRTAAKIANMEMFKNIEVHNRSSEMKITMAKEKRKEAYMGK